MKKATAKPTKPKTTEEQPSKHELARRWLGAKARLASAKAEEAALRSQVISAFFPLGLKEGTNKEELPDDDGAFIVKVTQPFDRAIDEGAFDAMKTNEEMAKVNFDALVRVKRELAVTAYKATFPEGSLTKSLFDTCLTVKPGSPQLEVTYKPKS